MKRISFLFAFIALFIPFLLHAGTIPDITAKNIEDKYQKCFTQVQFSQIPASFIKSISVNNVVIGTKITNQSILIPQNNNCNVAYIAIDTELKNGIRLSKIVKINTANEEGLGKGFKTTVSKAVLRQVANSLQSASSKNIFKIMGVDGYLNKFSGAIYAALNELTYWENVTLSMVNSAVYRGLISAGANNYIATKCGMAVEWIVSMFM